MKQDSTEIAFRRLLRSAADPDHLAAKLVNLLRDHDGDLCAEPVKRDEDAAEASGVRHQPLVVLFLAQSVLMDRLYIPAKRPEHVHEEDAGLGVGEILHAASASRNRSKAMAPLICGRVRWGKAAW